MYKQKLQELCQQRQWALPLYTSAKDGPDHKPRFWASVTVHGATFDSPHDAPSHTSKDAQNEAARLAFHHFSPSPAASPAAPHPPPAPAMTAEAAPPQPLAQPSCSSSARIEVDENPARNGVMEGHGSDVNALTMDARDMQNLYKMQLQSYAQKRNLNLPTYDYVCEGSLHFLRFKASVTVDGQVFESPQFFSTLKDADHAAAKVAVTSLSTVGNQEEEHGFYKNLVQELAQKEGLTLPTYKTVGDGPSHMPIFYSSIEIEGEKFQGSAAKTKKQAEINAAKVAWTRLRERKLSKLPGGFSSRFETLDVNYTFSSLPLVDSQLPRAYQPPLLCSKPDKEENIITDHSSKGRGGSINVQFVSSLSDDEGGHVTEQVGGSGYGNLTACLQKPNSTEKREQLPSPLSSDAVYARLRDPFPDESLLSDDDVPSMSPPSKFLGHSSTYSASICPSGTGDSSLLCNRVCVYPRRPDFQLAPGTKILPFSDETWIAVSVEPEPLSEGSIAV